MIRIRLVTWLLAMIGSGVSVGCAQRVDKASIREFALTVALASPLRTADTIPEEIVQLSLAMHDSGCPGTVFLPKMQLARLDVPDSGPIALTANRDRDWIARLQDFYGQHNLNRVNRDVERALRSSTVPGELLKPAGAVEAVEAELGEFIDVNSVRQLFILDDGPTVWPAAFKSVPATAAKTPADLSAKLAVVLCDSQKKQEELAGYVVLLNPPPVALGVAAAHRAATGLKPGEAVADRSTPRSAPNIAAEAPAAVDDDSHPRRVEIDADQLFAELEYDARDARPEDRRRVDEALKAAQQEFPHDYRFSYARAQLAVYGRSVHHDAFGQLFHAAEVAIANGDADAMLARLGRDSDHDAVLHKLAQGHREWQTLVSALRSRNAMLVHR